MDSRYFAIVLRATLIPCSARMEAILLSLSGFCGCSAATSFLISALIAVDEQAPPKSVLTWLEKKYFNSKMPRGVCIYFRVVTLEMVDSCISRVSAISCRTSGFIASSPYSRKARCRSTIEVATRNSVSLLLCRLLMNQRASCR